MGGKYSICIHTYILLLTLAQVHERVHIDTNHAYVLYTCTDVYNAYISRKIIVRLENFIVSLLLYPLFVVIFNSFLIISSPELHLVIKLSTVIFYHKSNISVKKKIHKKVLFIYFKVWKIFSECQSWCVVLVEELSHFVVCLSFAYPYVRCCCWILELYF